MYVLSINIFCLYKTDFCFGDFFYNSHLLALVALKFKHLCIRLIAGNLKPKFPRYALLVGYALLRCDHGAYLAGRLLYSFK